MLLGIAYTLIYLLLFFMGAALASFMNVIACRLPQKVSPFRGRSACPSCGHTLGPGDLAPLVSYIALGGCCRYCRVRIPVRYALVEAVGGLAAVFLYLRYGLPSSFFYLAVFLVLMTIALIDFQTMLIPNGLNITLGALGMLAAVLGLNDVAVLSRVIGMCSVSVFLLVLSLIVPGAFGGGDMKLMAAAGFLLGWQNTLLAFFIGILLGGAYAALLVLRKKAGPKAHMAFGPYLCAGIFTALIFGEELITWYLALFLR